MAIGEKLWFVDDEDEFRIRELDECLADIEDGLIITEDGEAFQDGELGICTSEEVAKEVREQMLEDISLKEMAEAIHYFKDKAKWEQFETKVRKLFRKTIEH